MRLGFGYITQGWSYELAQTLTAKGFQIGEAVHLGALRLMNGAFNTVATDILVRCTFAKPNTQFMEVGR